MAKRPIKLAHRNLPLLMLQARELVISRFRPLLNEQGITEQQWRVIRVLLETGPLESREISAQCHLSSPSLAGILSRMEDLDLVVRERLGSDQRRVRVSLRPRSRELAAQLAPQINATYRQIEAQLGAATCQHLYAVLDGIVDALSTPAG
jgi:homoprotocatechuate degradation regulator HpaR